MLMHILILSYACTLFVYGILHSKLALLQYACWSDALMTRKHEQNINILVIQHIYSTCDLRRAINCLLVLIRIDATNKRCRFYL